MNSNIASSFCNMNKKKESNMLQTTIYLADRIPRQSQRAINLSLVFQLKFNSKVKEVEEDLLHHCRPQPRKTETHSACKQFCSCDAQQKNTVVIYHKAKSSDKIIFNTITVHLIAESNTRNQKKRDLLFGAGEAFANNFALESATFFESEPFVVLGKTSLPLFVHHQYESDPHLSSNLSSFTST